MNPFDRLLPQDLEAERAVLGSMLQEESAIDAACEILGDHPEAFGRESHASLYRLLLKLRADGLPIDSVLMADELQRQGLWEKVGGFDFLAGLLSSVPSAIRVSEYAIVVREKWQLRQAVVAGWRLAERGLDGKSTAADVVASGHVLLDAIDVESSRQGPQALGEIVPQVIAQWDSRKPAGLQTQFYELDNLTGGLQPANLIVIAARPSVGKSALMLNLAEYFAIEQGFPVAIFSLEMSREELTTRLICGRSGVPSIAFANRSLTPEQRRLGNTAAAQIEAAPLFIDDRSNNTATQICAKTKRLCQYKNLAVAFIDYLQLIQSDQRAENRNLEIGRMCKQFKACAKDCRIPVVLLAQINRAPERRTDSRPRTSDLRDSGEVEQDADLIVLGWDSRDPSATSDEHGNPVSRDDPPQFITWLLEKQRNGPHGRFDLAWDAVRMKFTTKLRPPSGDIPPPDMRMFA